MNKRELIVIDEGVETRYDSVRQAARCLGIALSTLKNRLNGIGDDGRIYKYAEERECKVKYKSKAISASKESSKPEPPQKVCYETLGIRVCITPCQFKQAIKVASVLCQACASYRGIKRSEKYVLCAFKGWTKPNEKKE